MAFEDFHPGGLLTSIAVGAADGFASANDAQNGRTGWKRAAFAVQGAAFLGGVVAEFMGAPAMYTEAAMGMSLGLAAREGVFKLVKPQSAGATVPVQGYRESADIGDYSGRVAAGGGGRRISNNRQADVGYEGYLQTQPAGILG